MQRVRSLVTWLVVLSLPWAWGWGTPQAVLCVRSDGVVAVETTCPRVCQGQSSRAEFMASRSTWPSDAPQGDAACEICADIPLHVLYPTATPPVSRPSMPDRALLLPAPIAGAQDLRPDARPDTRAFLSPAWHVPLDALRTVVLLV